MKNSAGRGVWGAKSGKSGIHQGQRPRWIIIVIIIIIIVVVRSGGVSCSYSESKTFNLMTDHWILTEFFFV